MEIIIRKNIFSPVNKYSIRDSGGRNIMRIERKLLSIYDKHTLMDITENPICEIKRKIFSLFPKYRIYFKNGEVVEIYKNRNIVKRKFFITSASGNYTVEGDVMENNFKIKKGEDVLAKVEKKLIHMFRAYDVQIQDKKYVPFVISAVIAIDIIKYKKLSYLI